MSSLSSQANRLQTVIRRKRKRAPFIEESQLSAKEPKKKKTKKNEEVVVRYGFECEHCPKDGTDDTDKQKAEKHLQRLCLCKKKTYESDRKVGGTTNFLSSMSNIDTYIFLIFIKSNISSPPSCKKSIYEVC